LFVGAECHHCKSEFPAQQLYVVCCCLFVTLSADPPAHPPFLDRNVHVGCAVTDTPFCDACAFETETALASDNVTCPVCRTLCAEADIQRYAAVLALRSKADPAHLVPPPSAVAQDAAIASGLLPEDDESHPDFYDRRTLAGTTVSASAAAAASASVSRHRAAPPPPPPAPSHVTVTLLQRARYFQYGYEAEKLFGLPVLLTLDTLGTTGAALHAVVRALFAARGLPVTEADAVAAADGASSASTGATETSLAAAAAASLPAYALYFTNEFGTSCAPCSNVGRSFYPYTYSRCSGCQAIPDSADTLLPLRSMRYVTVAWGPRASDMRATLAALEHVTAHPSALAPRQSELKATLGDCFRAFARPEVLGQEDAWLCPRCKSFQPAVKTMSAWSAPNTLIVHLKRFSSVGHYREKIDQFIGYGQGRGLWFLEK
jgi:hypothetical protein